MSAKKAALLFAAVAIMGCACSGGSNGAARSPTGNPSTLLPTSAPAAGLPTGTPKANPTGEQIGIGVYFVNAQTGWISGYLGDHGAILATTDGGKTWHEQYASSHRVGMVKFVSPLVGWAVVYPLRGPWGEVPIVLLHTVDGGEHWMQIGTATGGSLVFFDSRLGRTTSDGALSETTDGGRTWRMIENSTRLDQFCFNDASHGWAVGSGHVYRTTDGGRTWVSSFHSSPDPSTFEPKATATGVACIPGSNGAWAFFGGGVAAGSYWAATYRTLDAGATWSPVLAYNYPQLHAPMIRGGPLALVDESTAYMASDCEPCLPTTNPLPVFRTTDGGTTWTDGSPVPGMAYAWAISFPDRAHGWIAGFQWGSILDKTTPFLAATTDGGRTWKQQYP